MAHGKPLRRAYRRMAAQGSGAAAPFVRLTRMPELQHGLHWQLLSPLRAVGRSVALHVAPCAK